jgi:adenine-specific DNA glycosylase
MALDPYNIGYDKGRSDTLHNHPFCDLCPFQSACGNYTRGYITGRVEEHRNRDEPFDWKLVQLTPGNITSEIKRLETELSFYL